MQNTLAGSLQGDDEGGICSTHPIGMKVMFEKKKGRRGLRIPKRGFTLVFAVRQRKGKENVCFLHLALFLCYPFITTDNEKRELRYFLNFVSQF